MMHDIAAPSSVFARIVPVSMIADAVRAASIAGAASYDGMRGAAMTDAPNRARGHVKYEARGAGTMQI